MGECAGRQDGLSSLGSPWRVGAPECVGGCMLGCMPASCSQPNDQPGFYEDRSECQASRCSTCILHSFLRLRVPAANCCFSPVERRDLRRELIHRQKLTIRCGAVKGVFADHKMSYLYGAQPPARCCPRGRTGPAQRPGLVRPTPVYHRLSAAAAPWSSTLTPGGAATALRPAPRAAVVRAAVRLAAAPGSPSDPRGFNSFTMKHLGQLQEVVEQHAGQWAAGRDYGTLMKAFHLAHKVGMRKQ